MVKDMFVHFIRTFVLTASLAFCVACVKDIGFEGVPVAKTVRLSVVAEPMEDEEVVTKSNLSSGIEAKFSNVTVALYHNGKLFKTFYSSSPSVSTYSTYHYADLDIETVEGWEYTAYALVNMGDMRSSFPDNESGVSNITYTLTNWTGSNSVSAVGIPMAGSATTSDTYGGDEPSVSVRRLFAKVNINASLGYSNADINGIYVYNLNRVLRPFGTSTATDSSQLYPGTVEYQYEGAGDEVSMVFYVPENCQGNIGSTSSSLNKSPDRQSSINSKSSLLTYFELLVDMYGDDWSGTVSYRSYLGRNATTNFDVVRNRQYVWNVNYTLSNLTSNNYWKIDTDGLETYEYEYWLDPSSFTMNVGATATFALKRTVYVYDGNVYAYSYTETVDSDNYSISGYSSSVVSCSKGSSSVTVSALSAGSTTVTVYDYNHGNYLYLPITVNDVYSYDYSLSISPSSLSVNVGSTGTLSAYLTTVTYKNGNYYSTDGPTLLSSGVTWSSSNTSKATVSGGTVTGVAAGSATITAYYTPSGSSQISASASVTVSDSYTYSYSLSVSPSSLSIYVDDYGQLNAYLTTVTYKNGNYYSTDGPTLLSSGVTWSSSNTSKATVSGGTVTGVAAGSATITAYYTPSGSSQISASASVTVTDLGGIGVDPGEGSGGNEGNDY